jgi:hypothetical protein
MATTMEKLEYRKEYVFGVEELNKPSSEELWKRLYANTIETSTNGDIRLIGAWMAYHEGVERALLHTVWPSRGHSYALVDTAGNKRIVRVIRCHDHRNGIEVRA